MLDVEQEEEHKSECAVCKKECTNKCSACRLVAYCSKEHQKSHWKTHKPQCRPLEIRKNDELGRYIVCSRDVDVDTILINEGPLIYGPKLVGAEPLCLGCYRPIDFSDPARCLNCLWPACHAMCPALQDPNHHLPECIIFSKNKELSIEGNFHYEAILPLRCLLLQKRNPKKWNTFLSMQSHIEERGSSTDVYKEIDEKIVRYLRHNYLLKIDAGILSDISSETLHKICAIIEVNALDVPTATGELSALYPTACYMEHSCIPNTKHSFNQEDLRISVISSADIKCEDHVTTMYTHALWGTAARREHLKMTKYFDCKCKRCADPTELNTNLSTLKCIGVAGDFTSPCGGQVLPNNPLDHETDWQCNLCPVELSSAHVADLMSRIALEVDNAMEVPTIEGLEEVLKNLEQLLHKNHYHCFMVKHSLIQLYGREVGALHENLTEEQLNRKIQMCKDLLEITTTLDPTSVRLTLYTAVLMFELHSANLEVVKRSQDMAQNQRTVIECRDLLERTLYVLRDEPPFTAGYEMLSVTRKGLSQVNDLLDKTYKIVEMK